MDIHALQQIVHQTRDARRKQTLPKFSPAERDQLIHKYHPDFRERAYRPIRFGPNVGDKTVVELATLLEGNSPIADEFDLTADYTTDVLVRVVSAVRGRERDAVSGSSNAGVICPP